MKILVAYASAHGSTAEVAAFIGRILNVYEVEATVAHAETVQDVSGYDAFVLGSPIHSSMWLPSLSQFMFRFEKELAAKPVYMWMTCLIVMEENGREKALSNYLWQEALDKLGIVREDVGTFAGKLSWDKIDGNEKWLLTTNYEGKELPGSMRGDYRNWQEIAAWTHQIAQKLLMHTTFTKVHEGAEVTKNETITTEEVEQLQWPENPNEIGPI